MDRMSLLTWVSGSRPSDASMSDHDALHRPGDILLTCKPFVHSIADHKKGSICDLCLRPPACHRPLRSCSDCGQLYFCHSCLSFSSPSIFKALHLLECPILSRYGSVLSSSTKLFLRLYFRITDSASIPHQQYFNPLTKEEITFESLVPRIIYTSKDELCEQIKSFCDKTGLQIGPDHDGEQKKKSIEEIQLSLDASVEELAILQFMSLLTELSHCDDLVALIGDDTKIYQMWTMFVRLWSYVVPIHDETISGLFPSEPIAFGLYLEPNVLIHGHSCLPNCALAYYGPVLQLRAMKPIYPNQPLTVNLASISVPKKERIKELYSYFISDCSCNRCSVPSSESHIDFKHFRSLKDEFVTAYCDELGSANKTMSLSTILNFSTNSNTVDDFSKLAQEFLHLHEVCNQLFEYYEHFYPFSHPEKSRLEFARLSVEMNLLLFKLELRGEECWLDRRQSSRRSSARLSDCSEFSTPNSYLDSLTQDISEWSALLKGTVRNIRWTHGVDHRLFREMAIPLAPVWRKALGNKKLTLQDLHSEPTVLLKILCSQSRRQGGFFRGQIEQLSSQFKLLIGERLETSLTNCSKSIADSSVGRCSQVAFRAALVVFAFLFPFIVYYTVCVDDF